ncbi:MAG: hypothetical protein KGI37_03035 [Alphaproteobacteria bacterium]|nr:hypothetical protein [Alphaproteobacteria bacterium]
MECRRTSDVHYAFHASKTIKCSLVRIGGSYTHNLGRDLYAPLSVTLSGAAAHAFDTHAGMVASIGSASFAGNASNQTWGEFGATLNAALPQHITATLGITGTTGAGPLGTSVHAIAGVGYVF